MPMYTAICQIKRDGHIITKPIEWQFNFFLMAIFFTIVFIYVKVDTQNLKT